MIAVTSNGLKFEMLGNPDHLQNWLNFGHCLLSFLIFAAFWLSETGQICDNCIFVWERKWGMARNLARWWMLTTYRTDYILFTVCWFSSFILVLFSFSDTGQIGGFRDFLEKTWEQWPKFDMLIYPDHLWNWLLFGHGLLISRIIAAFWLCETGQISSLHAYYWEFFHVCSAVPCQSHWPLMAKGYYSYYILDLLFHFYLVISKGMKKASFSIRKLFSYRGGFIPDYCLFRLV